MPSPQLAFGLDIIPVSMMMLNGGCDTGTIFLSLPRRKCRLPTTVADGEDFRSAVAARSPQVAVAEDSVFVAARWRRVGTHATHRSVDVDATAHAGISDESFSRTDASFGDRGHCRARASRPSGNSV